MNRRVIVTDVSALRALTSGMIGLLVDAGVEIIVPDYVAEEHGGGSIDHRLQIVETGGGQQQRNVWELWRRAGRPDDLRPVELSADDRMRALGKLIRNPADD